MVEEIELEKVQSADIRGLVTLTLDWVMRNIIVEHSSTSTYQVSFDSEKLFVDGWTDIQTGFIRSTRSLEEST